MELFKLIDIVITLCYVLLLARIVLGFVLQYITMQGNTVPDALGKVYDVVFMLTEPVLGPIRRMLPQLGTIDLSPLVVLIVLFVVRQLLIRFLV